MVQFSTARQVGHFCSAVYKITKKEQKQEEEAVLSFKEWQKHIRPSNAWIKEVSANIKKINEIFEPLRAIDIKKPQRFFE